MAMMSTQIKAVCQCVGEFAKVAGHEAFTIAAVASRKVLCVNPRVQALSAAWRINDECLELQSTVGSKKQVGEGACSSSQITSSSPGQLR